MLTLWYMGGAIWVAQEWFIVLLNEELFRTRSNPPKSQGKVWLGPPKQTIPMKHRISAEYGSKMCWLLWRIFRFPPNSVHTSLSFTPTREARHFSVPHLNRAFFFAKFVDFHNGFLRFFPQQKTPKKNRTWKAWQRYIIICCALDWEVSHFILFTSPKSNID